MEKILYLVHTMGDDDYNYNYYNNKKWDELKISSIDDREHQFPGVYFTLITKDNIKTENLYYFKTILIFSKKLLEQENYHININDYNGFINEKNTYFPWNLDKAVKKIKTSSKNDKYGIGNEVIFHDPIPMKYLCLVINNKSIDDNIALKNKVKLGSLLLPPYELYNEESPDMTKIPFYCFPLENNYTGINKFKLSSKTFYEKMAILCNVNKLQSREKIIEDIKNKILELYNDRKKQNIKKFKLLTNS